MAKKKPANPKPEQSVTELSNKLEASRQLIADKDELIKQLQQELEKVEDQKSQVQEDLDTQTNRVDELLLQIESDKGLKNDPNPEIESLKRQVSQYELALQAKHKNIQELTKQLQTANSITSPTGDGREAVGIPADLVARCIQPFVHGKRLDQVEKQAPQIVNAGTLLAKEIQSRCSPQPKYAVPHEEAELE